MTFTPFTGSSNVFPHSWNLEILSHLMPLWVTGNWIRWFSGLIQWGFSYHMNSPISSPVSGAWIGFHLGHVKTHLSFLLVLSFENPSQFLTWLKMRNFFQFFTEGRISVFTSQFAFSTFQIQSRDVENPYTLGNMFLNICIWGSVGSLHNSSYDLTEKESLFSVGFKVQLGWNSVATLAAIEYTAVLPN